MSDQLEIRHIGVEEMDAFYRATRTTFLEDAAASDQFSPLRAREWQPERSWGASADGRVVATLRTMDRRLTVPGCGPTTNELSADALTGVTVAATHHRQGLLRRMLTQSLQDAHERGDPLSILVAAEWAIYGRFGYWPAATWADLSLAPRRPGAKLRVPVTGRVRQVEPEELRAIAPAVFDVARRHRAGHINRTEPNWDLRLLPEWCKEPGNQPVAIVHHGADGIDGMLSWQAKSDFGWTDGGKIAVSEFFATNQEAYTALWGYLLDLDVVDEIRLGARPPDEPLPLLLIDGRSVQTTSLVDAMWVRLLDVPKALSTRGYATAGRLCIDVVDEDTGGYAAGRYLLDAGPEGAQCRPAPGETPHLRLSQRALAGIYLGQPSLRAQQAAGLVDELEPGAVARADVMFGTALAPWVGSAF